MVAATTAITVPATAAIQTAFDCRVELPFPVWVVFEGVG